MSAIKYLKGVSLVVMLVMIAVVGCKPVPQASKATEQLAQGFILEQREGYTIATIYNPFEPGSIQAQYCLTREPALIADSLHSLYTVVRVPVRRMAVTSCTHIGMLSELGATDILCGVTDPSLIYNAHVRERVANGEIMDLGSSMQIQTERVVGAEAEVIMLSAYSAADPNALLMKKLGIPVIYNNEWTEQSPLGRAEWIRFIGALVGREAEADSIFSEIRSHYETLCQQVPTEGSAKRSIVSGSCFRGTWYVPAGGTYMGRLFADAGAEYFYAKDASAQSLPLSMETVLQNLGTADVWVGAPATTLSQLAELDDHHTWMHAYQTGDVYHFNRRSTPDGANDFWEMGVVHPDLILQDLISVLRGESDSAMFFTERLRP